VLEGMGMLLMFRIDLFTYLGGSYLPTYICGMTVAVSSCTSPAQPDIAVITGWDKLNLLAVAVPYGAGKGLDRMVVVSGSFRGRNTVFC
jgi:hypothetical protein